MLLLAVSACHRPTTVQPSADPILAGEDWSRDILDTALEIDLGSSREAIATITLAASTSEAASFEVGDLAIESVTDADGAALLYVVHDAQLDIGVPATVEPVKLRIAYQFRYHDGFTGADSNPPLTFTWPYYCGNLFPCKAHASPADGTRFTLDLSGVPDTKVAVYPASIANPAPAYMLAWAIDDYIKLPLGTTTAGTEVAVWHLPGGELVAQRGSAHLVAAFDWFEQRLGPYAFGRAVGAISARWPIGAFGGMEHHPFWHIASRAFGNEDVHLHEAAHGWFGDGVRLRCWEDFTMSEGTVSYLAAHVLGEVGGQELEDAMWVGYQSELDGLIASGGGGVAWPDSCGAVDILSLFEGSRAPYTKGAYFYRAVAERIGDGVLDDALAAFYRAHRTVFAGMQDVLDAIEAESGWDPTACAAAWLRSSTVPTDYSCP